MNFFFEGFFLQAGLILGLGAQNIFVLESGISRSHHQFVAFVCSLCDLILILFGVLGAATLFIAFPTLKIIFGILGVAFLAFYGLRKLYEAFDTTSLSKLKANKTVSLKKALMLTLGFSLLNPHVYLDTLVLIGGYASKHSALQDRLFFGLGASFFSMLWFFALANLSSVMSPLLVKPKAMRLVNLSAGCVLSWLGYKLGREVLSWL